MIPRPAEEADFEPLADLWDQRWHDAHADCTPPELAVLRTRADFLRRLRGFGAGLRVIGPAGSPEGFVAVVGNHLDQLYVSRALAGRGAADILVTEALRLIAEAGHAEAVLECNPGNTRAAAYYRKSGWRDHGLQRVELDSASGPFPFDCLVFSLPVSKS